MPLVSIPIEDDQMVEALLELSADPEVQLLAFSLMQDPDDPGTIHEVRCLLRRLVVEAGLSNTGENIFVADFLFQTAEEAVDHDDAVEVSHAALEEMEWTAITRQFDIQSDVVFE